MKFHADSNSAKIRHVDFGVLPCLKYMSEGRPNKKSKKDAAKGSVAFLKSLHNRVGYFNIFIRENLFHVNLENWDRNTPSISPEAPGTKLKFGKERVHCEVLSNSVHLISVVLARRKSRTDHMRRP